MVALLPVPPAVVTEILPVAVAGTAARMLVADKTVNGAETPLKLTDVAPARFVPVIVTPSPRPPVVGLNDVTVGITRVAVAVKLVALVAVPPAATTLILPVIAPTGTPTTIEFAETTLKAVVFVPPKLIEFTFTKFVPVIVTLVPGPPVVAVNEVIEGAGNVIAKAAADEAVPPGVTTLTNPLDAPVGTTAVIDVALTTVKDAASKPLNLTRVAPVRAVPVIVTDVPAGPLVADKAVIIGAGTIVNDAVDVTVSPLVVTLTVPVIAVAGTTTVSAVAVAEVTVTGVAEPLRTTTFELGVVEKPVPLIVTDAPIAALVGASEAIVCAATTVTGDVADAIVATVTEIVLAPNTAVVGTVTVSDVADAAVTTAATAPIFTLLDAKVAEKPVPVITSEPPRATVERLVDVMAGLTPMVKVPVEVTVSPLVVTFNVPVVAPNGTTTVNAVAVAAVTAPGVAVPAKTTMLFDGVVEKPVPVSVIVPPT